MSPTPLTPAPLSLGDVTLRNRLVSAPMERNYCTPDGYATEQYVHYLAARARAGVAMVTTEATFVRQDGKGRTHQLGAHDDSCVPGLRRIADALHAEGALMCCELNHGGRTAQSALTGRPNVAPSPVPCLPAGGETPRELTAEECRELARDYGRAAERCVRAGVDVLSIHAAHGYLVHQFMSPISNHRTDEFAAPERFLDLVVDEVRAAAPGITLGVRVSVLEGPEDGLGAEDTLAVLRRAGLDRVDFIDLSAGSYEAGEWIVQSGEWRPGLLTDHLESYREFGLPLGLAGRLNSPGAVEEALAAGADFVSLARALHADPGFATACLEGTPYRPCIACNVCIDNLGLGQVACSVNPEVGRGGVPLPFPEPAAPATATVVGGGPAGITAARELARAGLRVTLLEHHADLGGDLTLAARMKSLPDFGRFLEWAPEELERLGVDVRLGRSADPGTVADTAPDLVVVATGGRPRAADTDHGTDVRDWLRAHHGRELPEHVTVWGSDAVAMSTADTLADRGCRVLLLGEGGEIAPEAGRRAKILALPRLTSAPEVDVHLRTRLLGADGEYVEAETEDGRVLRLPAPGPLLRSRGQAPDEDAGALVPEGIPYARVGAADGRGATLREAVWSGYDAAQSLLGVLDARPAAGTVAEPQDTQRRGALR